MSGLVLASLGLAASSADVSGKNSGPSKSDGDATPLVTGKSLTPLGTQTDVGNFPANMVLSPDGRYVIVTTTGFREYLSVLGAGDGARIDRIGYNAKSASLLGRREGLYYGLACGAPQGGQTPLYVARGGEGFISVLSLGADGKLTDTGKTLSASVAIQPGDPKTAEQPFLPYFAGVALSADGGSLYAADNEGDPKNGMHGSLYIFDTNARTVRAKVEVPGYPYAVAAVTAGPEAGQKVYVTSEQRGVVTDVDPGAGRTVRDIPTGAQPMALALNRAQTRLYVANAGSDTVSVIDTTTDLVLATLLVRPDNARGLPGATPTGLALAPDERRLYVTLGDMNAVAVVDLPSVTLAGYLPVGWYPTAAVASVNGRLFVANAKGVAVRNPNDKPVAHVGKRRTQYDLNIIEGTVTTLEPGALGNLKVATAQVLADNQGRHNAGGPFVNPGIKHVFYIIKENRTYDQVLGDEPRGNGDPAVLMFGRDVTPNQHALADRFALLDNFCCCAEVWADGWKWSTGGMASEYTERNVPNNYSKRRRPSDFHGINNGVAVDRQGLPDVARPPGGYLWDMALAHGVSLRNYGFLMDDLKLPETDPTLGTLGAGNSPTKRALVGKSDTDFRQFDLRYADSDAWVLEKVPPAPKQKKTYGSHQDPCRFDAWKREFDAYVKSGNLPALSLIRFGRDHTLGTTPGASTPRAMVADNDYAVGETVEAISKSRYWKSSLIVILEDDAQNGYDHVDAHRSTAYVISPFVRKGLYDSRFYNTDSMLRTIELVLGLPPMNQYDAIAPPFDIFSKTPDNDAPYHAVLPNRTLLAAVNGDTAYRAEDSARLLNPLHEESAPDEQLNDILWRSIKGTRPPPRHYSLTLAQPPTKDDDD